MQSSSHKRTKSVGFHLHERCPARDREDDRGCWGPGGGNGEFWFPGDRVSVLEDEKVLEMNGGEGHTTV